MKQKKHNKRILTKVLIIGFFLIAVFQGAASSATFTVNSAADEADANPGNGTCATANSVCTLRAAIQEANAVSEDDIINIPAGVYLLTIAGTSEDAAATGDLDIIGNVTIIGAGAASTNIDAGAIDRVFHITGVFAVNISGVAISNALSGANGGGIYNLGALTLTNVAVSGNTAQIGGGIFNEGTLTITKSAISGNTAAGLANSSGGGIYDSGTLNLTNATISGNSALSSGGGIYNLGTANLTNVTVTNNTADSNNSGGGVGGGIYNSGGTFNIINTIAGGNTVGSTGSSPDCFGTLNSGGYNLIQDTIGCAVNWITTGNITGVSADLGALANNGGPTQTHALLSGSPAIDAGDDTACPTTDQRGISRPQDGDNNFSRRCDIGAYEVVETNTDYYSGPDFGYLTSGGCGGPSGCAEVIRDYRRNNEPPALGMAMLLLPVFWLMCRRIIRALLQM
jgi:CSLREA domain-containing protein